MMSRRPFKARLAGVLGLGVFGLGVFGPGMGGPAAGATRADGIAFARWNNGLWTSDLRGGHVQRMTSDPKDGRSSQHIDVSQRRSRITFVRGNWRGAEVYMRILESGRLTRITHNQEAKDLCPDWSPSGRRLAWMHQRPAAHPRIFVSRAFGQRAHAVAHSRSEEACPSWAPGGRRLVFVGTGAIKVVSLSNPTTRRVTPAGDEPFGAEWSQDGRWILWVARDRTGIGFDLYAVHPSGSGRHVVVSNVDSEDGAFSLADSSNRITFIKHGDVWVIYVNGAQARRLTTTHVYELQPVFVPGRARILYATGDIHSWIGSVAIDGSGNKLLTHGFAPVPIP